VEHLARVDRILSFFQQGDIAPDMSERATSNSANPLNKSCVREANLADRHSHEAGAHASSTRTAVAPGCASEAPKRISLENNETRRVGC
jgi:hypothetical protein